VKQKYIDHKFGTKSLALLRLGNDIIAEYAAQGFDLTLRQLYYQLVARDHIPNTQQSYKRLGKLVSNGRLAGLIDWDAIVDRTRHLRERSHWTDPQSIIQAAERSYHIDMWEHQAYRPEVWIEKDALIGVIAGVCNELDTPFFACRGYISQSSMYRASKRVLWAHGDFHYPIIFHLGDHDPSGMDMTRDIVDRLELLTGLCNLETHGFRVDRLALNWEQIEEYGPPPNPAKLSDSRANNYIEEYGPDSWELDALEPQVIVDLIRTNIEGLINKDLWRKDEERKSQAKTELRQIHKEYDEVVEFLGA
jgi:hypothetical protein